MPCWYKMQWVLEDSYANINLLADALDATFGQRIDVAATYGEQYQEMAQDLAFEKPIEWLGPGGWVRITADGKLASSNQRMLEKFAPAIKKTYMEKSVEDAAKQFGWACEWVDRDAGQFELRRGI